MKTLIRNISLLALGILPFLATAQTETQAPKMPVNEKTGIITYTKVTEVNSTQAAELYQRGLNWASTYYKNPYDVIRERDSVNNSILCKARFKITNPPDKKGMTTDAGLVMYTLKMQFKDGRYRTEITDINWKQTSYYPIEKWMDTKNPYYREEFNYYLQLVDNNVKEIIKNLDKSIQEGASAKGDDW